MRGAVPVVGDRLNVAVDIRVEVLSALAVVDPPGNHVPQVRDDARADHQLALAVVVDAPGGAEAVRARVESILRRVIAPDAAVDLYPRPLHEIAGEWFLGRVQTSLALVLPDFRAG